MLDALTLNLNALQHLSETVEPKKHLINQDLRELWRDRPRRIQAADSIEELCKGADEVIQMIGEKWSQLPEDRQKLVKDALPVIDNILKLHSGWTGFLLWLVLLPESIRRKKNLHGCLVKALSRLDGAISDTIAKESIRIGWKEVMTGKTIPLTELWDRLDTE